MPTDNFLAQVADLDRRARDAGMEGVLPDHYFISKGGEFMGLGTPEVCMPCPHMADTAAVTHWLREFVEKHTYAAHTPSELLLCAERIIMQKELSNANQT